MASRRRAGPSANERLRDREIRHAIMVSRYRQAEARKIASALQSSILVGLERRLFGRLERIKSRGMDRGPWTTQKYREMIAATRETVAGAVAAMRGRLHASLEQFGAAESSYLARAVQDVTPFRISWNHPPIDVIRASFRGSPIDGRFLRDDLAGLDVGTRGRIGEVINRGMLAGDGVRVMRSGVRDELGTTAREAETIVRTAVTHVHSSARRLAAIENDDLVKGEQWHSTLDLRVSRICFDLDGQVFPIDEGIRPPAHRNCRSVMILVLKSMDEILGVKGAGEFSAADRASMDGAVAGRTDIGEWLSRRSRADQDFVLGRSKAALWRAGHLKRGEFTTDQGREFTVAEILDREGISRSRLADLVDA